MSRDAERLDYRRQFAIGPSFLDAFPSWQRLRIGPYRVTVHPDLPTCQAVDGEFSVTLFGYILDPDSWELNDEGIVRRLLSELIGGRLIPGLSRLGGRWVIVANTPEATLVFNDAFGLRQVHYTVGWPEQWCGAQPGLLATTLRLSADDRALAALGHSANREFWFPGRRTLYKEVARLEPNHSLDLRSGRVARYWPDDACRPCSLDEVLEDSCAVIQGLFRAAHARFPIAQTITAGWDSRLSLAASRKISSDIFYVSMRYWNMPSDHQDLVVPGRLLPSLGLDHHVIECPDTMDPAFERRYMQNVIPAHYAYGTIAQGMHDHWPAGHICVKSNVAAVIKRSYILPPPRQPGGRLSAEDILRRMSLAPSAFTVESLEEWIDTTVPLLRGFDVSDIFHWEQRVGSWQAGSQHEWDIVADTFDPLNCRRLLGKLLGVPHELRGSPSCAVHRRAIEHLWPEALAEPINPQKRVSRPPRLRRLRQWMASRLAVR